MSLRQIHGSFTILLAVLVPGCHSAAPDPRTEDTPTTGDIVVLADQDFSSIIEAESKVFEHFYPKAHLRIHYLPEAKLLRAMMSDTVRLAFTSCLPGGDQQAYFDGRNIDPAIVPILTDGMAAIVSERSSRRTISMSEIVRYLGNEDGTRILVDDVGSGIVRTLADSLFAGEGTRITGAAASSGLDELLRRVASDTTAIGLIAFAHISDLDDPHCVELRQGIRPLEVAATDTGQAVPPNQGMLADGRYPLRRKLHAVLVEGKSGLGTGFVSFVAGHKGQRIILRSGLVPHKVPTREVMIVNE